MYISYFQHVKHTHIHHPYPHTHAIVKIIKITTIAIQQNHLTAWYGIITRLDVPRLQSVFCPAARKFVRLQTCVKSASYIDMRSIRFIEIVITGICVE